MSIKKKLAMGIATGALAVSMIGGGTYAYFSDTVTSTNTFTAGTLDLVLKANEDNTQIIDVNGIKPGDWINKKFTLKNNGTLDIDNVLLDTKYKVVSKEPNQKDFGKHIQVTFKMYGKEIYSGTLFQLKEEGFNAKEVLSKYGAWPGLKSGIEQTLDVEFKFNNNGDQNEFQGDSLELTWNFKAEQGDGVEIK